MTCTICQIWISDLQDRSVDFDQIGCKLRLVIQTIQIQAHFAVLCARYSSNVFQQNLNQSLHDPWVAIRAMVSAILSEILSTEKVRVRFFSPWCTKNLGFYPGHHGKTRKFDWDIWRNVWEHPICLHKPPAKTVCHQWSPNLNQDHLLVPGSLDYWPDNVRVLENSYFPTKKAVCRIRWWSVIEVYLIRVDWTVIPYQVKRSDLCLLASHPEGNMAHKWERENERPIISLEGRWGHCQMAPSVQDLCGRAALLQII